MNVLEKILEEISEVEKEYVTGHKVLYALGATGMAIEISRIIHSHMDEVKDINVPSNDGWIPVEERLPEDCEEIVLVQVSGKMAENIWFDNAFELATYVNGEGWILENYPEWENPKVIAWQPLPEPYKPKKDIEDSGARS